MYIHLIAAVLPCCLGVEIVSLTATPAAVEAGAAVGPVVLACTFRFGVDEEKQLDIKWYADSYAQGHAPFVQWLPGNAMRPQLLPNSFPGHVEVVGEEEAEADVEAETRTMTSTIRLNDPRPEHSGAFKCKVASLEDEDFKQTNLVVYGKKVDFTFHSCGIITTLPRLLKIHCYYIRHYVIVLLDALKTESAGRFFRIRIIL